MGIGIYLLIHKCQEAIIDKDLFASITLRIKALVAFDGICQLIQTIQEDYKNKNLKKFLVQISHETDLLMILKMNLGTNDPFHSFREYLKQQVFFHSSLNFKINAN